MLPILEAECVTESAGGDIGRVFRTLQRARYLPPLCFHCCGLYSVTSLTKCTTSDCTLFSTCSSHLQVRVLDRWF
jgi:hypothetical protein